MKIHQFLQQITIVILAWLSGINMSAQAESLINLTQVSGKIFLNTGTNYIIAQPGVKLNPGDRILALQNSSARLNYPGNCAIQVNSNSLFTVGKEDQCLQTADRLRRRRPPLQLPEQNGVVVVPAEATGSVISPTLAVIAAAEGAGAAGAAGAAAVAGPTLFGVPVAVIGIGSVATGAATAAGTTSGGGNGGNGGNFISAE